MKLSFQNRVLATIFLACVICVTAAIAVSFNKLENNGEAALVEKSQAILSRLEVGRKYVAKQGQLENMVQDTVAKYPDGKLTTETKEKILQAVPVYAALKLGAEGAEKENYEFRVFAREARNKDNTPNAEELGYLKQFDADPRLTEIVVRAEDGSHLKVIRPVYLSEEEGCFTCHGHPSTSPWGNGKDVLGYEMENWKDGKLHGAFAVISSLEPVHARSNEAVMSIILWGSGFTIFALFIGFITVRGPIGNITRASEDMKESGVQVGTASSELSSVSASLSASASESAASLEETVSSLEELSSMVSRNTDNAKEAAALSSSSRDSAEKGEKEISDLISAMTDISSSSKQIEEIINVIDDIAFQTNLLALNAAVEAARAGEQGKGFAVVADAVRNLAGRSADAAKEITTLIKESSEKVERGASTADASAAALNEIVNFVKKVSDLNNEIATASEEQSTGLNQINQAMNQLDKVTQQNAASAEEAAAGSEEMSAQAHNVQQMANRLFAIVSGGAAPAGRPSQSGGSHHHSAPTPAHNNNVTQLQPKPSSSQGSDLIPFDEDDSDFSNGGGSRKVGNLSDF
ncbi:MAG: chemotaxis protein [Bdellovibrionaceae bacterium]|nr:chemotaxis protein [Pseudobdellovibrionaceae bacterium]|tara:strand:- start:20918 stop:22651 length:1734 start_codon:yes stop_codon:yes gene_type:complete